MDGSFELTETFTTDLSNTSSAAYMTLNSDVSAGILAACQAVQPMASCSVANVRFAPRSPDSNVLVSFTLRVNSDVTAAQVTGIFQELVARAENNQLVANRVVLANTVALGGSTLH